jgi:hypothetical protein
MRPYRRIAMRPYRHTVYTRTWGVRAPTGTPLQLRSCDYNKLLCPRKSLW